MMREIKFRAWDVNNKCWYEPIFEAYKGKLHDLSMLLWGGLQIRTMQGIFHESAFPNDEKYIINQYTGLKDKNGKEVYEGDIVRHVRIYEFGDDYSGEPVDIDRTTTRIGKIVFYPTKGFILIGYSSSHNDIDDKHMGKYKYTGLPTLMSECAEIIGNIHENPELL